MSKSGEQLQSVPQQPTTAEAGTSTDPELDSDAKSKRMRTILGVLLIVGVVAAVGICAAVFAPKGARNNKTAAEADEGEEDRQAKAEIYSWMVDNARSPRATNNRNGGRGMRNGPCYSLESNDTIPAAHITGRGLKWAPTPANDMSAYETAWTCGDRRGPAFVDGGMYFSQTDKALYVPKCGYYYIESQVYFQVAGTETSAVAHNVYVDRNCGTDEKPFILEGYSSVGGISEARVADNDPAATSTHVGEIVKMCSGGKIRITFPSHVPCCPFGRSYLTHFGASLAAETNCDWPLPISSTPVN